MFLFLSKPQIPAAILFFCLTMNKNWSSIKGTVLHEETVYLHRNKFWTDRTSFIGVFAFWNQSKYLWWFTQSPSRVNLAPRGFTMTDYSRFYIVINPVFLRFLCLCNGGVASWSINSRSQNRQQGGQPSDVITHAPRGLRPEWLRRVSSTAPPVHGVNRP